MSSSFTEMILKFLPAVLLACAPAVVFAAPSPAAVSPRAFYVRDYGAAPNGTNDAGEAIRAAVRAAVTSGVPAQVVFDSGTYRVRGEEPRGICLPIHRTKRLTTSLQQR